MNSSGVGGLRVTGLGNVEEVASSGVRPAFSTEEKGLRSCSRKHHLLLHGRLSL